MSHHLDRPIASDLSQRVLELRQSQGELNLNGSDSTHCRLYHVPSFIVKRRQFIGDVDEFTDSANPSARFADSTLDVR